MPEMGVALPLPTDGSRLISWTPAATSSFLRSSVGVDAARAGDEPPVLLGTKTAAATFRALNAPLKGLAGAAARALAEAGTKGAGMDGDLAGDEEVAA